MKKEIKVNSKETQWLEPKKWTIRNNTARKNGEKDTGSHPAIAVGKNGRKIANIGITHDKKRGHHNNVELSRNLDPKDKRKSYIRTDLQYHDDKFLKELIKGYRNLTKSDIEKIQKIINKKK